MTVRHLIEHLSMLPRDAEVLVCDGTGKDAPCGVVEGVYLERYAIRGREGAIRTAIIAVRPDDGADLNSLPETSPPRAIGTRKIRSGDDGAARPAIAV